MTPPSVPEAKTRPSGETAKQVTSVPWGGKSKPRSVSASQTWSPGPSRRDDFPAMGGQGDRLDRPVGTESATTGAPGGDVADGDPPVESTAPSRPLLPGPNRAPPSVRPEGRPALQRGAISFGGRVPDASDAVPAYRSSPPPSRKARPRIGPACRKGKSRRGRLSWLAQSARLIRIGRSRPCGPGFRGQLQASGQPQEAAPHLALVTQGQRLVERELRPVSRTRRGATVVPLVGGGLQRRPWLPRAAIARRQG